MIQEHAEILYRAGLKHHQAGQLQEAQQAYQLLLTAEPNHADAMHMLAVIACQTRNFSSALDLLRRAIEINPNQAVFFETLGNAMMEMRQFEKAAIAFERSVQLNPQRLEMRVNLAKALDELERQDEALDIIQKVLTAREDVADWQVALGTIQIHKGDIEAAIKSFRRAVELQPELQAAHAQLSMALLLNAQFSEGWAESRWWLGEQVRSFPSPRWEGEEIDGKTILLVSDHGFGDAMQMIRYAPLLVQRGARVIVECFPPLARLMRAAPGVSDVVLANQPPPAHDLHAMMMSLPFHFQTTLDSIPGSPRYLSAPANEMAMWATRLTGEILRVGLAWAGNPVNANDARRSCPAEMMNVLANVPGVQFFSLQKQRRSPAAAASPQLSMLDFTPEFKDFADTAALIENLDLVICVDTAVAHLAGAMGKPVWLLLTFSADWRWLMNRGDSPWYPTMKIFRQRAPGDWPELLSRVAAELSRFKIEMKD